MDGWMDRRGRIVVAKGCRRGKKEERKKERKKPDICTMYTNAQKDG